MMRIKQSKVLFHFCKGLCHEDHPFKPIFDGISYNSVSTEDDLDLVMDSQRRKYETPLMTYKKRKSWDG